MKKLLGHVLVLLQFGGIMYVSYLALITFPPVNSLALIIAGVGALVGIAALRHNKIGNFSVHPHPRNHAKLITTGPYRWVRHPMYLSVFISLIGLCLQADHIHGWIALGFATAAMIGKTYIEEGYLVSKFPAYKEYQGKTKRLLPYLF